MRLDHLLSKEQPPSVWVGKPHVCLCVVLIFGWNVTKTLTVHCCGVLCACVVCSLDGVRSVRVDTLLGCGGTGTVVWFFLLLFLFVNSGREHLMNDRRDCLLLCVIWFAARFIVW